MNTLQTLHARGARAVPRGGFTLAELMVVIVIIGMLATFVAPKVLDRLTDAKWGKVKGDIHSMNQAIVQFAIANGGQYPDSLEALVMPDQNGKKFLDRDTVPKDPWGHEYGYEPPMGLEEYRVICYGKDGQPGGEGDDRDYDSRDLKNE